jgi:hypothetical protein
LKDVPLRPRLTAKYPLIKPQRVGAFIADIERLSVRIAQPASAFALPRDPNDEPSSILQLPATRISSSPGTNGI